jgi:transposase
MRLGDFGLAVRGFSEGYRRMVLPKTGSSELLEVLSPFVPDDYVNELLPRHRGAGRRREWSAAQLYRTLLLLLLTPARSSNLLCQLLPEQRAWRRFAHLPNRRVLPNVRQLHEFRDQLTPAILRRINEHLLKQLMAGWPNDQQGVALFDATDLPAATNEYKKKPRTLLGAQSGRGWPD